MSEPKLISSLILPREMDELSYEKLITGQLRRIHRYDIEGIYVGEGIVNNFLMNKHHIEKTLELISGELAQEKMIFEIKNTGINNLINLSKYAEEYGINSFSFNPVQLYSGQESEFKYRFEKMMEYISRSLLLHMFPVFNRIEEREGLLEELLSHEMVIGVIFNVDLVTDFNLEMVKKVRDMTDNIILLSNNDQLVVPALKKGIDGVISQYMNIIPKYFLKIQEYIDCGDWEDAAALQGYFNKKVVNNREINKYELIEKILKNDSLKNCGQKLLNRFQRRAGNILLNSP